MLGQNNEVVYNINRSLIIQFLQRNKLATRAQLSKALKLTPASITKIVNELIEKNLIEETGYFAGEKGRRSVGIKLKNDFLIIGAKISRRSYSVGVFAFNAEKIEYYSKHYENESLMQIINNIKIKIKEFTNKHNNIATIGVAVPGPYLHKEYKIILATETKGWEPIDIRHEFDKDIDIPVTIMHDANACALADWWFGDYDMTKTSTLAHMLVGAGVGAGVIINGDVFTGDNGLAGEIGHVSVDVNGPRCECGNYGCLEMYCSALSLVKRAENSLQRYPFSKLHDYKNLEATNIFECAKDDELAMKLITEAGKYIGCGVVNIINAYNPTIVVLSNQMVYDSSVILEVIINTVKERMPDYYARNVKITTTKFKDDSSLYGAAAAAIDFCLKNHQVLA